jgi:hypothetical protein
MLRVLERIDRDRQRIESELHRGLTRPPDPPDLP